MTKISSEWDRKPNAGSKGSASVLIAALLIGMTAGGLATFFLMSDQVNSLRANLTLAAATISSLRSELDRVSAQYSSLKSSYDQLADSYSALQSSYNILNANYGDLQRDYQTLSFQYSALTSEYSTQSELLNKYAKVSGEIQDLSRTLTSYASLAESFPRVLNDAAVREVAGAVASAGVRKISSESELWSSYQLVYSYITSNIRYAEDVDIPYISSYQYVSYGGRTYVTDIGSISTVRNYVQTPALTLSIKQGDCDDQAVLAYAMIKYCSKYLYGVDYDLYIASVHFSKGSGHVAVFVPVRGGLLCVFDPAGRYLTTAFGIITSKPALSELQAYSSYWSSAGTITRIALYRVNVSDGSYTLVKEGIVSEVASAFN